MHDVYSILIILGIICTFVPQYVTIINRKTSLGLSPVFLLLGITSVLAQLVDILLLQIPTLEDCLDGSDSCFSDLLGILQVVVLTLSISVNCGLFLVYYPRPWGAIPEGKKVKSCIIGFGLFFLCTAAVVIGTVVGSGKHSRETHLVGQMFGILSTVISCVQYVPQIYKTWTTKVVGSLSPASLAIQSPGSFFFAYTVAIRPNTDFTTWGPFFVSGMFQAILVCICLIIRRQEVNAENQLFIREGDEDAVDVRPRGENDEDRNVSNENTPLLV